MIDRAYLMSQDELSAEMIALIYARVSTRQQTEGTSLETQVEGCLKLAKEKGFTVPNELVFQEVGSGADPGRRLFLKVNSLVQDKRVRGVFINDPDRYSREPIFLEILSDMCKSAGVELFFVHGTSGTGVDQNLLRYLAGYVAKKERLKTLERTTQGKMRVLKKGRPPHGWGVGIYGYDYDKDDHKRSINASEASTVRRIFQMFAEGATFFAIAEDLNREGIPTKADKKWHLLTVRRILQNERYIGLDVYGKYRSFAVPGGKRKAVLRPKDEWAYITGFTPPILDKGLFDRVQERLEELGRTASRRHEGRPRYWLTGYIYCGKCGTRVHGATMHRTRRYYSCNGTRKTAWSPPTCDASYIPGDALEATVWKTLVEAVQSPDIVMLGVQEHVDIGQGLNEEITDLEAAIVELKNREKNLIQLMARSGVDTELVESELAPINAQRRAHENRIQQLRNTLSNRRKFGKAVGKVRRYALALTKNLEDMDVEGKIRALSVFNVKVTATAERFSIELFVDPSQGEKPQ